MASNLEQMSFLKRPPFPGRMVKPRLKSRVIPSMTELQVKNYLIQNPKVFEQFVLESVPESKLEDLLKVKRERPRKPSIGEHPIALQSLYLRNSVIEIAEVLTNSYDDEEQQRRMEETAHVLGRAVDANDMAFYVPTHNETMLSLYQHGELVPCGPVGKNLTVAAYAVSERKTILVKDLEMDSRYRIYSNCSCQFYFLINKAFFYNTDNLVKMKLQVLCIGCILCIYNVYSVHIFTNIFFVISSHYVRIIH